MNIGKGWKYNALVDLQELEESYPGLFRLKLLGTHENFLVCDEKFTFVGSHNFWVHLIASKNTFFLYISCSLFSVP
ncbi:hypothetical protein [Okeania sp. SIO3B5]|uniref:hypothetical protein n=1 Tax=Okeania sp. SIO3B5 TaxID=2607811 RepID=UPI0025E6A87B|nr:hypothetical protein [Okeania sp. SIO3B5]